jgi:hypothetical protein
MVIDAKLAVLVASHGVHASVLASEYGVIFAAGNQPDDYAKRADLGLNKELSFPEHPAQAKLPARVISPHVHLITARFLLLFDFLLFVLVEVSLEMISGAAGFNLKVIFFIVVHLFHL